MNDVGANITGFFWNGDSHKSQAVPPEEPIQAISAMMRWQNAWMAAIAMAWASEEDKEALLRDAHTFFKTRCGWEVPEALDLSVSDQPDPSGERTGWYPDGIGGDPKQKGWHLARTKVIMYLPPKPEVKQQAVALANYLATGRTYPFTTC